MWTTRTGIAGTSSYRAITRNQVTTGGEPEITHRYLRDHGVVVWFLFFTNM
jgi:hypothetical protein